jgi:DNA repair ATPase RecN
MSPEEPERAAMWRVALEQYDRAEQRILDLMAQSECYGANPAQVVEWCDRAEQRLLALLAQTDRYGDCEWQVVEWEELLDRIASLHTQIQTIQARLDVARTEGGPPQGRYRDVRIVPTDAAHGGHRPNLEGAR